MRRSAGRSSSGDNYVCLRLCEACKLDADIYLPALVEGMLGSRNWMAAHLGARGGRAKSRARAAASRRNGRLGGRPKKKTAA
jgi:hypothetical protein